jgi:hypothetical protein
MLQLTEGCGVLILEYLECLLVALFAAMIFVSIFKANQIIQIRLFVTTVQHD